jgi:hypothetical protein
MPRSPSRRPIARAIGIVFLGSLVLDAGCKHPSNGILRGSRVRTVTPVRQVLDWLDPVPPPPPSVTVIRTGLSRSR